jgi:hypothetical protein
MNFFDFFVLSALACLSSENFGFALAIPPESLPNTSSIAVT